VCCCDVGPDCNRWEVRINKTAIGASHSFTAADAPGCKDYCVATPSCVGVDFEGKLTRNSLVTLNHATVNHL